MKKMKTSIRKEKLEKVFIDKKELCCPITLRLFDEPVFVDGYTFEKEAIEQWFVNHDTNPQTNIVIPKDQRKNLKINFDKKSTVESFRDKIIRKCLKYYKILLGSGSGSGSGVADRKKMCKKLMMRADELREGNIEVLENILKLQPEKKEVYLIKLLQVYLKKKDYDNSEKLIISEKNYDRNTVLLAFLIKIKELKNDETDKLRFKLGKLYFNENKFQESEEVLKGIKSHDIESLKLIIFSQDKQNKEVGVKYVDVLCDFYYKSKEFDEISFVVKLIKNLKERQARLIKLKDFYVGMKDTKKASLLCLAITETIEDDLEKRLSFLQEGNAMDPSNIDILQLLYESTERYSSEVLKLRINDLENNQKVLNDKIESLRDENMKLRKGEKIIPKTTRIGKTSMKRIISKGRHRIAMVIHRDYICDGCRSQPIIGPRYSSTALGDYDLCEECYEKGIGKGKNFKVYYEVNKASHKTNDSVSTKLKRLKDMGFYEESKNKVLLAKHNGDIYKVIKELVN